MFIEIVASMALGIAAGTFTGLIPGVHPNTVFVVLVSGALLFSGQFPGILLLVFIISVAVSNTFTDFLPSIIFGAPDPSTALSVLPGHKMLLQGRGHEAIALTVIGGIGVALLTVLTAPLLFFMIPAVHIALGSHLHIILSIVVIWMLLTEKGWGKLAALTVLLLSGALGVVTLNMFPSGSMLFPSLTGLFALGTLLTSYHMKTVIPEQVRCSDIPGDHKTGVLLGWLGGWFAGMLPGIGASQAGVVAAQVFRSRTSEFITTLGGINTSNIMFTLIMLFTIGKTRSGAMWAISQFTRTMGVWDFALLMFTGLTVCFISGIITIKLARALLNRVGGIDYGKVTAGVIILLIFTVVLLSGIPGIIAAITGTFIGLVSINTGIKRSHMMGYLLVPTILHFSGYSPVVMVMFGI